MMNKPCQYGFKCPYIHINEDWDMLCTYPYIQILDDSESFGFPDEQDCALMDFDSELYKILDAYEYSQKVRDTIDEELAVKHKEDEELIKKLYKDVFGD